MVKSFIFAASETNRMFNLLPPVQVIGYLPQKKDMVKRSFQSCNFSFILEGEGEYILNGRHYEVKAPCMLIQWPDEPMNYGPHESWKELFFIYSSDTFPIWQQAKILDPDNPVRRMYNAQSIIEKIGELQKSFTDNNSSGDSLDLLCYNMILDTWVQERTRQIDKTLIPQIRRKLEKSLGRDIDCRELAKDFNMSLSTLRRYWSKYCGSETFMQYRNSYFLQQSSHYLLETDMEIKEIAEKMNFQDQFYFSKKFHLLSGMPPVAYRKKYAPPEK